MKTHPILPVSLAATLLTFPLATASAGPLVLTNVSASKAAARMGAAYHIGIVLKANAARHVNVALDDADDAGSRLQTVNALANALRLDFTKTIVVRKSAGGGTETADTEAVDSDAAIPFGRTTLPAREAITLIAGVDNAFARIAGDIGGVVTLSQPTLTVRQAEREVARQTGTTWKAVYVLAPRALVCAVPSPLLVFPDRQREAQERREEEAAERQAAQEQAAYQQALAQQQASLQAAARPTSVGPQGINGQAMPGNGYYPNGYGGGNPYASGYPNSGYNYGGYNNGGYPSDASGFGSGINTSGNAGGNFPNHVVGGGQ